MRSAVIVVLLAFFSLSSYSQNVKDTIQVHTDKAELTYKWKLISDNKANPNKGCYGCASFYYKIERTINPDKEGFYHYFLYLMSNSFYKSGNLTGTYVRDIKIDLIDGEQKTTVVDPFWVLVPPRSESFSGVHMAAKFKSADPKQVLSITWGEFSVY